MTYPELCRKLDRAGIGNAAWEAALLLERFCGAAMETVALDPGREYLGEDLEHAADRRVCGEPLQYILGEWEFYRQKYLVTPDCLIPRPDTEILVEEAIRLLPEGAFFADLCTGSGCIAISTLAERKDTHALAVDLSLPALEIARRNAAGNGVADRVTFLQADLLDPCAENFRAHPLPDAILSNPPYIRTDVLESLSEEVRREPRMALDGGTDGLIFYRALLSIASVWLKPDGFCLFEIGYDQGAQIGALAKNAGFECEIRKDYGGCDRVAILRRNRIK